MVVWSGSAPGEDAGVFYSEQCPVGLVAQYYNNINLERHARRRRSRPERQLQLGLAKTLPPRESWARNGPAHGRE